MKYEPLQNNKFYHIYNRGNNGENLFIEDRNYPFFLSLVQKHIIPIAEIHAYCLLKNHFHLLIKTLNADSIVLSKSFSNLFNAYAKAINKAYNRNGSLFQDRFSRIQIKKY
ncbi:transposase [Zunongwangia sp. HRR-M8]|uniref:transposase n=1 Tax=Zunongwangia sp. HRR-M8 TaxID=3015170 RepID=UPI0022DD7D49|nr:transposase [Zunongwangia sp. HRR-M8]WBL22845.1 transposase [Zunongwangia sp. HRR-M8]